MKFSHSDKIERKGNRIIHESAGGFLFFEEPNSRRLFVALLKNKAGEYVIPKGHLRRDEGAEKAAMREIKEELSLHADPLVIGKIGVDKYAFNRGKSSITHYKSVHLYVFQLCARERILPLKVEGFVSAIWLEFNDALKKIAFNKNELMAARKIFYHSKQYIKNLKSYKLAEEIVKQLKVALGANLFAIISAGSAARKEYKDGWSDIDLLLVVERMSFKTKNVVAGIISKNERRFKTHFGVNVITRCEAIAPNVPMVPLDGKTLQALLELEQHPSRLLYIRRSNLNTFYAPSGKEVRKYSLANIGMFFRRNRKNLTSKIFVSRVALKKMLKKEIRASLTITKLAIQCFGQYSESMSLLDQARKTFPAYDFRCLALISKVIDNWSPLNDEEKIKKLVKQTDHFIESFSLYIFKKSRVHPPR